MRRYLLAVALLVLVPMAGAHAADSPSAATAHTPTAAPTATPIPTSTSTPTASPSPSPSPTPATIGGSGGAASCPTGIFLPVPLTGGWCIDPWNLLTTGVTSIWSGLVSDLENWLNQLIAAVLAPLTHTDNPADNSALAAIYNTLANDATYAFAVLFGLGALWVTLPAMFGRVEDGLSLLLWGGGVMAAVKGFPLLLGVWMGAVNGLSSDIGTATIHDLGHATVTLILAPLLLLIAGLERAVSIHLFDFCYEIAPLGIVCFVWPPARGIGVAWLRTFLYLSLLGPAYGLMVHTIAAVGGSDLWGQILMLGGLLVLDLLPGIVAALFSVVSHAGAGKLMDLAPKVAAAL